MRDIEEMAILCQELPNLNTSAKASTTSVMAHTYRENVETCQVTDLMTPKRMCAWPHFRKIALALAKFLTVRFFDAILDNIAPNKFRARSRKTLFKLITVLVYLNLEYLEEVSYRLRSQHGCF
jgi:hypothetical protein